MTREEITTLINSLDDTIREIIQKRIFTNSSEYITGNKLQVVLLEMIRNLIQIAESININFLNTESDPSIYLRPFRVFKAATINSPTNTTLTGTELEGVPYTGDYVNGDLAFVTSQGIYYVYDGTSWLEFFNASSVVESPIYVGNYDASTGVIPTGGLRPGDFWYVSVAGTLPGLLPEEQLEVGDVIFQKTGIPSSPNDFFAVQKNINIDDISIIPAETIVDNTIADTSFDTSASNILSKLVTDAVTSPLTISLGAVADTKWEQYTLVFKVDALTGNKTITIDGNSTEEIKTHNSSALTYSIDITEGEMLITVILSPNKTDNTWQIVSTNATPISHLPGDMIVQPSTGVADIKFAKIKSSGNDGFVLTEDSTVVGGASYQPAPGLVETSNIWYVNPLASNATSGTSRVFHIGRQDRPLDNLDFATRNANFGDWIYVYGTISESIQVNNEVNIMVYSQLTIPTLTYVSGSPIDIKFYGNKENSTLRFACVGNTTQVNLYFQDFNEVRADVNEILSAFAGSPSRHELHFKDSPIVTSADVLFRGDDGCDIYLENCSNIFLNNGLFANSTVTTNRIMKAKNSLIACSAAGLTPSLGGGNDVLYANLFDNCTFKLNNALELSGALAVTRKQQFRNCRFKIANDEALSIAKSSANPKTQFLRCEFEIAGAGTSLLEYTGVNPFVDLYHCTGNNNTVSTGSANETLDIITDTNFEILL